VQQERIDVGTQLGDDELDALRHQATDEVNVAAEPVQLGDRDRALAMLGLSQRGSQLRAASKRVGTLAGLDLDELTGQLEALGLGEPGNGLALRFQSEAGSPLTGGGTRM
jgi:uncharacterized protein with von Willebrand factor type A (vWA) domain